MRTRRLTALVGVIAVLAIVLGSPAAANASVVTAPPGAVEELRSLPSQVGKGLGSAGGIGDKNIRAMAWLYAQMKNAATTPVPAPAPAPVPAVPDVKNLRPITAPSTFARGAGAAAGPILGGFMGGFAVGTQGLEIYGQITGTNPFASMCGTPFEGFGSVVYMGYMPDCKGTITTPEPGDITTGGTLTYGSFTMTFAGQIVRENWNGWISTSCYITPVDRPSGTLLRFRVPAGFVSNGGSGWSCSASNGGMVPSGVNSTGLHIKGQTNSIAIPYLTDGAGNEISTAKWTPPVTTPRAQSPRVPSCVVQWDDGTTTIGTGKAYTEHEGLPVTSMGLGCKSAWDAKPGAGIERLPSQIGIESTDSSGAKTEIATQKVPEYTEQQKKSLLAPSITEGLKLWKGKTSCMTWDADCASWWSNTQQGTTPGTGEYRCTFNKAAVDLSECGVYRETFDTRTEKPTITDPQTGEKVDAITKPDPHNSINPGTGPGSAASPGDTCMSQWSAAPDPIQWVLHPVKCALVWAFVPRPTKPPEAFTKIDATIKGSFPGQLAIALGGMGAAFAVVGDGSCAGIPIQLPNAGTDGKADAKPLRLMAACPGDFLAPYAPPIYWAFSAAVVVIGVLSIKNQTDRFVNN